MISKLPPNSFFTRFFCIYRIPVTRSSPCALEHDLFQNARYVYFCVLAGTLNIIFVGRRKGNIFPCSGLQHIFRSAVNKVKQKSLYIFSALLNLQKVSIYLFLEQEHERMDLLDSIVLILSPKQEVHLAVLAQGQPAQLGVLRMALE